MKECISIAIISSVIGYTYAMILIQPGEILNWLYRLFKRMLISKKTVITEVPEELQGSLGKTQTKIVEKEHWLLKPLGACEKCTAGQIAFWLYLAHSIIEKYYYNNNSIFVITNHIFTICLTIILTVLLRETIRKIKNP